jgi:hypothetical protein
MDPTVRELVLLALLSAFLCGVALIYAEPIATAVFAALASGPGLIALPRLAPRTSARVGERHDEQHDRSARMGCPRQSSRNQDA